MWHNLLNNNRLLSMKVTTVIDTLCIDYNVMSEWA